MLSSAMKKLISLIGHEYKLEFMYDDVLVTSTTLIPSKPANVSFSATLVDVKSNIDGGYGIFTGIRSVSRSIKVSKGSSPF